MIDEKLLTKDVQAYFHAMIDRMHGTEIDKDVLTLNKDICGIIERQPKADWIPCESKLPPQPKENPFYENKPLQVYLVSVKSGEEPFRAFWNGKYFTDGWSKLNVEAWMELPQPYKKEGAE